MFRTLRIAILAAMLPLALLWSGYSGAEGAEPRTVCTITVNSADEKEAFRRRLPKDRFRFVELVEQGRRDWLKTSCEKAIQCDVLVVSGHFNAGDTFYSDRVGASEYLDVDELERASCSGSCPMLFSRLKEVYLFGCESLNPGASTYASSQGDGGRERMRRIFAGVPVIYGFSATAPVGATAGSLLERYFDAGTGEIATGRASARLLRTFSGHGMASARGVSDTGAEATHRAQVCGFYDERTTPARKLSFVHEILGRDMARAAALFEHIDGMPGALTDAQRNTPEYLRVLSGITADGATRERFLAATRAAPQPVMRSRMIALAETLGWLSPGERRAELVGLVNDVFASRSFGFAEVGVVCALADTGDLDHVLTGVRIPPARAGDAPVAAVMACLGDPAARVRILAALASKDEREVEVAQAYLRHRPISDVKELRAMARQVSLMPETDAQIRAFGVLGRMHIEDLETVEGLTRSFAASRSIRVQRAIAEILLRSGSTALGSAGLAGVLRRTRVRSPDGDDLIEAVIRRLQATS